MSARAAVVITVVSDDAAMRTIFAVQGDSLLVNAAGRNFALRPDAQLWKDLPGFQAIPFGKIGLYVDEYRRRLPTAAEAGRVRPREDGGAAGYEVLDRE